LHNRANTGHETVAGDHANTKYGTQHALLTKITIIFPALDADQ
jgi:hypothetical protein